MRWFTVPPTIVTPKHQTTIHQKCFVTQLLHVDENQERIEYCMKWEVQ